MLLCEKGMIVNKMKRYQERIVMEARRRLQSNGTVKIMAQDAKTQRCVIVGTYKREPNQLKWIGKRHLYNYPLSAEETRAENGAWDKVKELWLYSGTKDRRHIYEAEFVGIKSRKDFLAEHPDYPKGGGRGHGDFYAVFSVRHKYQPTIDDSVVTVRVKDFTKRTPKIAKAIKAYQAGGELGCLLDYLPVELAPLTHAQLRVCEEAVQLQFVFGDDASCSIAQSWHLFPKSNRSVPSQSLKNTLLLDAPTPNQRFTHIDCFSGVGGFCTGLHAAGFDTKVAIEKVKSCVDTYATNHPEVHVINNDITQVRAEDILPYCPENGIDLVTSGMPCETFSTAGNTSRSFYDERQFLFREGIRVAQITNAKYLLFENVPGITSKMSSRGGKTLIVDILKKEMIAAGYANFIEVVLDAAKFGVPQIRKRYFVLGTRLNGKRLLRPVSRLKRTYSVADALEGLPSVVPNTWTEGREYQPSNGEYASLMRDELFWRCGQGQTGYVSYHMPMKHRPATLERFSLLRAGESLRDLFARYSGNALRELQSRRVLPNKMFIKRNYRLPLTAPSPTVTSHCLDEFVHPTENRALTVRECARLQSFPDSYDFAGGPYIVPHINRDVQDKYEQIGDAVPPLLAYAWGKTIFRMLMED